MNVTFVEVVCCDVATRRVVRRYYSDDGLLQRLQVWDGSSWEGPIDLLSRVVVHA